MDKPLSDILLHYGENDLPMHAVVPPLFQTSIFCFPDFNSFRDALGDEYHHYLYTLGNNPTVNLCEEKLALLEHAEKAKLTSSGVSAIMCSILSCLKGGDHAIVVRDCYPWDSWFFDHWLPRFGVTCTYVDGCDPAEFETAIKPETRLIYLESPTTFTFKLQDLKAVATIAHKHGIKTIIDNTWATPLFQHPLDLGIDIVVEATSKYLGGNSDIVGGLIAGSGEDIRRIFETEFQPLGPAPDPFQAWLILRGMRNLQLRMPVHFHNALDVASFLETHPAVESVLYPFLPSHPQYELAKRQMTGGSGLFSFRLKTRSLDDVVRFTNRLKYFKRAVSWGGYESLVFPQAVKYPAGADIPDDRVSLIRVHIGIEDVSLLKEDLAQALEGLPEA